MGFWSGRVKKCSACEVPMIRKTVTGYKEGRKIDIEIWWCPACGYEST